MGTWLLMICFGALAAGAGQPVDPVAEPVLGELDSDGDGLPDRRDDCPRLKGELGFNLLDCGPMDLNPDNDARPECKARERVAWMLLYGGALVTHMAFAVVVEGRVHFADAFEYRGQGRYGLDHAGIRRLYRVGSTSKSVTAVAAKIMEERGDLALGDYVNDDDGTQALSGGQRTLRQLLAHQGAFATDYGAIHLFCYDGDLAAFWADPDDLVSPHYDSPPYGNLGGGYQYSAFNYSLAGAYLAHRAAEPFERVVQASVFDAAGMCTAMLDGSRAVGTSIGNGWAVSQGAAMDVGPYINLVSPSDERCVDNFYSSDDLPGNGYSWQIYRLDEAAAEARDPAGGVIDLAHFAEALLTSYRGPGGLVSPTGIRSLWGATSDLGCFPNCPYERYYGLGFFTDSLPGEPVTQVEHGGSRPGYTSAFVLRPEADMAVCVLADADLSTVAMSELAEAILDDFQP